MFDIPANIQQEAKVDEQAAALTNLSPREWESPAPVALIHCDSNPHNVIEHQGIMQLVNWENAGWADPAFDIADLCAQPNYGVLLPDDHHKWIQAEHSRLLDDPTLPERAQVYQKLLLVWWVVRLIGYLTEAANARLPGVMRASDDVAVARRKLMWEKACKAFNLQ